MNKYLNAFFPENPKTKVYKSRFNGAFEVLGEDGRNSRGRMMYKIRFTSSGYVKSGVPPHYIRNGNVKDPYYPSVFGVGYVGEGRFPPSISGKDAPEYAAWSAMFQRCYDPKLHAKRPTYKGCEVAKVWHNFQVFGEWYEEHYVQGHHLDKDIKTPNNKIYSPDTCLYVPQAINTLLTDRAAARGEWPVGVCFHKRDKKFMSYCCVDGKQIFLGMFTTPEKAHQAYIAAKNEEIDRKCEQYPQFAEYLINHKLTAS